MKTDPAAEVTVLEFFVVNGFIERLVETLPGSDVPNVHIGHKDMQDARDTLANIPVGGESGSLQDRPARG